MAYARLGPDSDVYIILSTNYVCYSCLLTGGVAAEFELIEDLKEHVREHIKAGHAVPGHAVARIWDECEEQNYAQA